MKTSTLLSEALGTLIAHGWVQGRYGCPEDGYCAIGALDAHGAFADVNAAMNCLYGAIRTMSITSWNDDPDRTFGEVEVAFLRAIEIAEG